MIDSCGIKRIIQLNQAINFLPLIVKNSADQNITNECLYSWSSDGVCWTEWTNYSNYTNITPNLSTDFYLRILISQSFNGIIINGCNFKDYNISIDSSNIFLKNFCGDPNLFQPYNNLDCALQLQEQLSDSIVCMFGIPIYYIRVEPKEESADYTFKEYVLHDVIDIKQIKLMIPDGQMPSSNPKLTEFDFDWETDWETEISKTQFAQAFGDDAFPKQRDFIYIPMMKRMWEVNSAYDEKNEGLMWRSTTWKLALVKFNDSTNIDAGKFEDVIDNWVVNKYEDLFGSIEKNEQERQTSYGQNTAPEVAATNLYDIFMEDSVRKQYTKQDVTILDKTYCNGSTVVARNIYKFRNENGTITYQKGYCGENGTISFILETPGSLGKDHNKDNMLRFGNVIMNISFDSKNDQFKLTCGDLSCLLKSFNTYMIIYKWNRNNFTTELIAYPYVHREDIPVYKLRPEMYHFDFEHPIKDIGNYDNNLISQEPLECIIQPYPVGLTNIKYYNVYLDSQESIKESLKYTTNHESCIINDLARPITSGHGYAVK